MQRKMNEDKIVGERGRAHGNEVSTRMMTPVRSLSLVFTSSRRRPRLAVCDADGAFVLVVHRSARPSFLMTICPSSFVR